MMAALLVVFVSRLPSNILVIKYLEYRILRESSRLQCSTLPSNSRNSVHTVVNLKERRLPALEYVPDGQLMHFENAAGRRALDYQQGRIFEHT